MSMTCADIQDRLPERAGGGLPASEAVEVESHLAGCADCREVAETLALLVEATPRAPQGLEARIAAAGREALRESRGRRTRWVTPAWGLGAAAVLALLLGRTLLPGLENGPEILAVPAEESTLFADDGMVAGAPVFDGLSDEDLALLLEEMDG